MATATFLSDMAALRNLDTTRGLHSRALFNRVAGCLVLLGNDAAGLGVLTTYSIWQLDCAHQLE